MNAFRKVNLCWRRRARTPIITPFASAVSARFTGFGRVTKELAAMANMWNEEHEEFIRENFRHKTYSELAEHFGVSQKAMESKIRRMGL